VLQVRYVCDALATASSATSASLILNCLSRLPLFMRGGPAASPAWFTRTAVAAPRRSAAILDTLRLSLTSALARATGTRGATEQFVFRLECADLLVGVFGSAPAGACHTALWAKNGQICQKPCLFTPRIPDPANRYIAPRQAAPPMACFCGCAEHVRDANGFKIGCVSCGHGPQNHEDGFREASRSNEAGSQKRDTDFG